MIDVMRKTFTLIIIMLVLIGAIAFLLHSAPGSVTEGTWLDPTPNGEEAVTAPAGEGGSASGETAQENTPENTPETDPENGPENEIWFYIAERSGRYEAFAAERPDLAFEDVVWMVNVDLDKPPYEDVNAAKDPSSILVLLSKHFYLEPDFSPPNLVNIGRSMMREEAAEAMNEMIDTAAGEGHHLWVQSGYRSFGVQAGLFDQYAASDGVEGADRYSARPGHSEHQTGLVADLNTISDAFGETPEGKWAAANSWYFGFIVRYTAENTDVTLFKPEPWHMRYIGRDAATSMHDLGILSFEEYWVKYVMN